MSPTPRKRVLVVAGFEWIYVSPSTISAVEMLAELGYEVHLLARRQTRRIDKEILNHPLINTSFYPWDDQAWHINLQNGAFTLWVLLAGLRHRSQVLLAIDAEALIPCAILSLVTRAPLIYFSLEITTWTPYPVWQGNPLRALKRMLGAVSRNFWKWAESVAHRRTRLTIIQDPSRARVLQEVNRLSKMKVIYVSPSLRTTYHYEAKPRYLQDKFNLCPDQIVLLSAGGVADYYRLHELAQAAYTWPEHWTLIIHGNFRDSDPYHLELLRLCDGDKVIASRGILPQEEFDAMVASAHVGLAFYSNTGPNHFHIASGKVMQYLRCGLPVVTNDFPNLKEIVERYNCGRCVKDEREISFKAQEILGDYKHYSETAQTVFEKHFRFDHFFDKVIECIDHW